MYIENDWMKYIIDISLKVTLEIKINKYFIF